MPLLDKKVADGGVSEVSDIYVAAPLPAVSTTVPVVEPVLSCMSNTSEPSVVTSALVVRVNVPEPLVIVTVPLSVPSVKSPAVMPEPVVVQYNVPLGTLVVDTVYVEELPSDIVDVDDVIEYVGVGAGVTPTELSIIVITPVESTKLDNEASVYNRNLKLSLPSVKLSANSVLLIVLSACVYAALIVMLPDRVLSSKSAAVTLPLTVSVSQYNVIGYGTFTAFTT